MVKTIVIMNMELVLMEDPRSLLLGIAFLSGLLVFAIMMWLKPYPSRVTTTASEYGVELYNDAYRFNCRNCSQKLKFKHQKPEIRLRCPKCGSIHEFSMIEPVEADVCMT